MVVQTQSEIATEAVPDAIEKVIDLEAPVARVWRAVTDHHEFGEWFRVKLDGPFVVGELSTGRITHPGCEHMKWAVEVVAMEPERRFAFTWCPYAWDPEVDYSNEPTTLVEFRLEATARGTRLRISESGFRALPDDPRRTDALRENDKGWTMQVGHITAHVDG
ncbi:MAG: SRPBCC family protein [Acidobacteriota bacterium]